MKMLGTFGVTATRNLLAKKFNILYSPCSFLKLRSQGYEQKVYKPWVDYIRHAWGYGDMTHFLSFFDRTHWRIAENSKTISVEGNIGVGKTKVAKYLADEFGLLFVPDVTDNDFYIDKSCQPPLDYRLFNTILPDKNPRLRFYTSEMLFQDPNPVEQGLPLYLQQSYYMYRFATWFKACAHLFNTGQGFITKRSVFSDYVFAKALKECGKLSSDAELYYTYLRRNTVRKNYEPHVVVYIKSPISISREAIKKRGVPWEVNGVTDEFLEAIKYVYETDFLPYIRKRSRVIEVDLDEFDLNETEDLYLVAEQIAEVDDTGKGLGGYDLMLSKWRTAFDNPVTMDTSRMYFSRACNLIQTFTQVPCPDWLSEGTWSPQEAQEIQKILSKHPYLRWNVESIDHRDQNMLSVMLGKAMKLKYNYERDVMKYFMFNRSYFNLAN